MHVIGQSLTVRKQEQLLLTEAGMMQGCRDSGMQGFRDSWLRGSKAGLLKDVYERS